ncbi:programmed cell death protein 5-like isoform X1 [Penaeus japonicus]|uniref:programmed cell death protein 5-like isoform X1 n=1 Tax=Penaeus japonicus TaxID=27405 RepID=UPI001C70D971|nr:programmed cell death protein 5-like isoform X1 [Penaeus japonicus]
MSDDAELAAIREKRMQELQGMQDSPFGIKVPGNQPAMQGQQQKQEEMMQQQQQAINGLLNQVLDQQARARLNTIMVAKPEKGKQVESVIVQMATSGQIGGKLSENDLIGLVERVNAQTQKTTTVKFDRRRAALDDDDDW